MKSAELEQLGMPSPMLVWSTVTHDDGSKCVLLDGVVADGPEAAARIAQILEERFNIFVDKYDHTPFPHEDLSAALEAYGASGYAPTGDTWLSIYGRLGAATVLGISSDGANLRIEIDDHWANGRGDNPAQPGSLVLLAADRGATELASILGMRVREARMPERDLLVLEFDDHDQISLRSHCIVWVRRDLRIVSS
ncbi:MAG: hypothetical protein DI570_03750 [Phenylobacterium zucineum]|nr:MAG: hypothetical protein DI570_03750 [Phenylobacterium zucineum]